MRGLVTYPEYLLGTEFLFTDFIIHYLDVLGKQFEFYEHHISFVITREPQFTVIVISNLSGYSQFFHSHPFYGCVWPDTVYYLGLEWLRVQYYQWTLGVNITLLSHQKDVCHNHVLVLVLSYDVCTVSRARWCVCSKACPYMVCLITCATDSTQLQVL